MKLVIKGGGVIASNSAVKIPGYLYQKLPILRKEDHEYIQTIAIPQAFDYVIVPSVQTGKDCCDVREALGKQGKGIHIIAKISNVEAVQNYQTIIKYAQGVLILRNELSFDLEPEKLVIAQKWMIQAANKAAVPVFIQSQVLESLVPAHAAAKRQETQDISNAVLEGADVFVLSHETSIGHNALNATILLAKSIAEAENVFDHEQAY